LDPVKKARFEAVLWDNDGVLVDTEVLFFEVTRSTYPAVRQQTP
jgi:beta-phosphoglucomutase-like phosphatase (HAD superfamily)